MIRKKYVFLLLCCFIVGILFLSKVNAVSEDLPLFGRIIFVDPGHGGY